MRTAELRDIARYFSIETSYTDAAGAKQQASKDSLVAAIEARAGVPLAQAAEQTRQPHGFEPVIVVWGPIQPKLQLDGEWDLELEDGSWRS